MDETEGKRARRVGVATLAVGAGAVLAYQEKKEGRIIGSPGTPQESATPVVRPPGVIGLTGSSTAAFVPLPPRDELNRLLRRASSEAVALARAKPMPWSWCLTTIASVQAKLGDLDGARPHSQMPQRRPRGGSAAPPTPGISGAVGHFQAECGLKQEARATLHRAVTAIPGVVGDYQKDSMTVRTLAVIVEDQARLGTRGDAGKTVERLLEFSRKFLESSQISYARGAAAPQLAAALTAVGDFEAAFRWSEGVENGGNVLGEIAGTASKCLDGEAASKFVREAAERLAKMQWTDETYFGLSDLAEAQARLGDVDAAKRSAKVIGEGPIPRRLRHDGRASDALIRVANVQHEAGDSIGARDTLRDAFRSVRDHPG